MKSLINMMQAFGVAEDQMEKAAEILGKDENTENLGNRHEYV